jgi:hypothetical protein
MNIHSTQTRPGFHARDLTRVAKLDRELAQGVVDTVDLQGDLSRRNRKNVQQDFVFQSLSLGALGGAAGYVLGDLSPIGAAFGVGFGAYLAFNRTLRPNSGEVEIELDGQVRKTRYYSNPDSYLKTAQEVRAEMLVNGTLGEQIPAPKIQAGDIPELPASAEVMQMRTELKELAAQRKLVADLGQLSRYGHPVLQQIDARVAAKFLTAKKAVFAVAGESKDIKHSLRVSAANNRSTVRKSQLETYIERQYDYRLTELQAGAANQKLPLGSGLPEGLFGVYRDQESCAITVASDEQHGLGAVSDTRTLDRFSSRRLSRDSSVDLGQEGQAKVVTTSSVNVRDLVTMGGVLIGLVGGMQWAPGVPSAALIGGALGGVVGRELGWLAQDRMPQFSR